MSTAYSRTKPRMIIAATSTTTTTMMGGQLGATGYSQIMSKPTLNLTRSGKTNCLSALIRSRVTGSHQSKVVIVRGSAKKLA
jgi:hypothetical protein